MDAAISAVSVGDSWMSAVVIIAVPMVFVPVLGGSWVLRLAGQHVNPFGFIPELILSDL